MMAKARMTVDDIYKTLGLREPDAFALERIRDNVSVVRVRELGPRRARQGILRGTGRTTRCIIEALESALEERPAIIVSDSPAMRRIILERVRAFATKLGRPDAVKMVSVTDRVMTDQTKRHED